MKHLTCAVTALLFSPLLSVSAHSINEPVNEQTQADLIGHYNAQQASSYRQLGDFYLPYDSTSFVNVLVTASTDFGHHKFINVYGADPFGSHSQIGQAVVVAKLLKPGEQGIVQVRRISQYQKLKSRAFVKGMGEIYRTRKTYGSGYKLTLLAKL